MLHDLPQHIGDYPMRTFGIVGLRDLDGREYDNYEHISVCLAPHAIDQIISGGGKGVDRLIERYALQHRLPFRKISPALADQIKIVSASLPAGVDLSPHARRGALDRAFEFRNADILSHSDEMIIFWNGAHAMVQSLLLSIGLAAQQHKRVTLYPMV